MATERNIYSIDKTVRYFAVSSGQELDHPKFDIKDMEPTPRLEGCGADCWMRGRIAAAGILRTWCNPDDFSDPEAAAQQQQKCDTAHERDAVSVIGKPVIASSPE